MTITARGDVIRRPQRFQQGDRLTAKMLNTLQDPISRLGRTISNLQQDVDPYLWRQIFQCQITVIGNDFVVAVEYREYQGGGTFVGSENILLAKPWLLRRTPFDGQTYNGVSFTYTDDQTRTATAGPDTETQRITPPWLVGDIIFGARNVYGGTSVEDASLALVALIVDETRVWAADPPQA